MDDEFLTRYRQAPRPEFARQLQERIERPMQVQKPGLGQTLRRWSPALLAASLVVAAALLFTLPPARALAQDFLDLFRVKKFAAITVDPARIDQLENSKLDIEKMLSDEVKVIQDPGKPVKVNSLKEASRRVGYDIAVPSTIPSDAQLQIEVQGAGSGTFTANIEKLQSILDVTGVTDVQLPAALNGAKITVTKPPAVLLTYTLPRGEVSLMQSPSPQVDLPPGVNLEQLGEIGLRVLGLSPADAHDFAQGVDWTSTFLIPIPANAAEVRHANVNGADGLMLLSTGTPTKGFSPNRGESVILWAQNGMVYGLHGNANIMDLVELANSVK